MKDVMTTRERVQRLLDQLDNPGLKHRDIELIQQKITVLKSQG